MSNIIVMAFSPLNIVGCLFKKKAYKGGVTGTPGPPSLRPCNSYILQIGDISFSYLIGSELSVL